MAFSIINNWKKLRSIPSGPDFERLKPVQGLRVYMSIMVVIVHAVLAQVAIPVSNPKFLEDVSITYFEMTVKISILKIIQGFKNNFIDKLNIEIEYDKNMLCLRNSLNY